MRNSELSYDSHVGNVYRLLSFIFLITSFCCARNCFAFCNIHSPVLRILCAPERKRLLFDQRYFVTFLLFHEILHIARTISVWFWLLPTLQWRLPWLPAVTVCRTNDNARSTVRVSRKWTVVPRLTVTLVCAAMRQDFNVVASCVRWRPNRITAFITVIFGNVFYHEFLRRNFTFVYFHIKEISHLYNHEGSDFMRITLLTSRTSKYIR
jgi:hypothetical protein